MNPITSGDPWLFALESSRDFGERLARRLSVALQIHEERDFGGGEHKCRPTESVADRDVWLLASLHADATHSVNDKLCRTLFFAGALKDAGARRLTLIAPYVAYSRKDRRTKPFDPVTTRYVGQLFEAVGVDSLVTVDHHNPAAFDNAFRGQTFNLTTHQFFARHFARSDEPPLDTVVAPDPGALKSIRTFADDYRRIAGKGLSIAVIDKARSQGRVSGTGMIGTIGNSALVLDDMIGGGTTMCRAVRVCREAGADRVTIAATHGLFEGGAPALFDESGIDDIVVTDTVDVARLGLPTDAVERIRILDVTAMLSRHLATATDDSTD